LLKLEVKVNNQYSLPLATRLPYTADNFHIHSGVKALCLECAESLKHDKFSSHFVSAGERSGKTHFAVWLHERATVKGMKCTFFEGVQFLSGLSDGEWLENLGVGSLIIVDDAEKAFDHIPAGASGAFVNFFEAVKRKSGKIVFLSRKGFSEFSCDEHVLSRLASSQGLTLNPPLDEDTPELIKALARQRGIKLGDRKVKALSLRLGRDLASLEKYFNDA